MQKHIIEQRYYCEIFDAIVDTGYENLEVVDAG